MSVMQQAVAQINRVILGKTLQVKLAVACLVADGHLLIQDLPGMGKTTLSHTLAHVFGLKYSRIQFTSDLLPADILGVSVFEKDPDTGKSGFRFHRGPVFSQVV
ncbi:MAG: AAA family ATPase, partial [Thalassolituus sp.]